VHVCYCYARRKRRQPATALRVVVYRRRPASEQATGTIKQATSSSFRRWHQRFFLPAAQQQRRAEAAAVAWPGLEHAVHCARERAARQHLKEFPRHEHDVGAVCAMLFRTHPARFRSKHLKERSFVVFCNSKTPLKDFSSRTI